MKYLADKDLDIKRQFAPFQFFQLIVIVILLHIYGYAVDLPIRVAFIDFSLGKNVSQQEYHNFLSTFKNKVSQYSELELITGDYLKILLEGTNIDLNDCESIDCLTKVGQSAHAPVVLYGSLRKIRTSFYLDVQLLNSQTSKLIHSETLKIPIGRFFSIGDEQLIALITSTVDEHFPKTTAEIITFPPNARIFIDVKQIGSSPQTVGVRRNIQYDVGIEKKSFETYSQVMSFDKRRKNKQYIHLTPIKGTLLITGWPVRSKVFLNREYAGRFPNVSYQNVEGSYDILVKKYGYRKYRDEVNISSGLTTKLHIQLRRKPKLPALFFSTVLPGSGQLFRGQPIKGLIFASAVTVVGYLTYREYRIYDQRYDTYRDHLLVYNRQRDLNLIERDINNVNHAFDEMKTHEKYLNQFLVALGGIWTINILEIALD